MENNYLPCNRRSIDSPSAAPHPSPIPTARGFRSAADPILSEYVDKSIQIPDLKLPEHVRQFKPDEIDYRSDVLKESDSVRKLLKSVREFGVVDNSIQIPELKLPEHVSRFKPDEIDYRSVLLRKSDSVRKLPKSVREFGVVRINNHGIVTEELRSALGDCERIFGLMVECCTGYGDHEKIVWRGDGSRIAEEAAAAIGERNCMNFRYHRANIIDRSSAAFRGTSQERSPCALSISLVLEPGQFCLGSGWGDLSFDAEPGAAVVAIGEELQELRHGGSFRSAGGKLTLSPFFAHEQTILFAATEMAVTFRPQ